MKLETVYSSKKSVNFYQTARRPKIVVVLVVPDSAINEHAVYIYTHTHKEKNIYIYIYIGKVVPVVNELSTTP
jgi:hypothetical protein